MFSRQVAALTKNKQQQDGMSKIAFLHAVVNDRFACCTSLDD